MFSLTVSDHVMVAHSLRGEMFGPAQQLHGATFVVEATFSSDALGPGGVVVDIGRTAQELRDLLGGFEYRNLDELEELDGVNTTTEVLAQWIADALAARAANGALGEHGAGLARIGVTLRESPVAWASYERAL